jgi:hypothetical protein
MIFGQVRKIYWMKKAASPPKILQTLFILPKNKVGTCRTHLSDIFFKVSKVPNMQMVILIAPCRQTNKVRADGGGV